MEEGPTSGTTRTPSRWAIGHGGAAGLRNQSKVLAGSDGSEQGGDICFARVFVQLADDDLLQRQRMAGCLQEGAGRFCMFGNIGIDLSDTCHYGGGKHLGR